MNFINNIQLSQPLWLLIAPIGIVLLLYFQFIKNYTFNSVTSWIHGHSRDIYRHPIFSKINTLQPNASRLRKNPGLLNLLSYSILLALVSLSLSQPFRIGEKLPQPPEYRDIVFIVDTSVSMVLRDYLVNGVRTQRMTVLKNVLTHFVEQLKGNRIQIIAYSEQTYTMVPLTTDYDLIKFQLQRLEPASLTGRSSDLSRALLYAVQPYKNKIIANETRPVFVMLTDADRPARNVDPKVAAEYIAQQGIRLHTIAIGAGSYEAEDRENISLVYHPTSFYLLEQIARLGNGQFFWAKDSNSLRDALISINETEKRKVQTEPEYIKQPLYFWPLLLALLWLLLLQSYEFIVSPTTPSRQSQS